MTPSPSDTVTNKDNELDQLATDLAAQVAAGLLPEQVARMQIFEKVYTSGILHDETRRWCHKNSVPLHMRDSVVDEVDHFYMLKILDLPTESAAEKGATDSTNQYGRKFFDLNQFADGASATGSIRQALSDYTLMHQTHYRSARRQTLICCVVWTITGHHRDEGATVKRSAGPHCFSMQFSDQW